MLPHSPEIPGTTEVGEVRFPRLGQRVHIPRLNVEGLAGGVGRELVLGQAGTDELPGVIRGVGVGVVPLASTQVLETGGCWVRKPEVGSLGSGSQGHRPVGVVEVGEDGLELLLRGTHRLPTVLHHRPHPSLRAHLVQVPLVLPVEPGMRATIHVEAVTRLDVRPW